MAANQVFRYACCRTLQMFGSNGAMQCAGALAASSAAAAAAAAWVPGQSAAPSVGATAHMLKQGSITSWHCSLSSQAGSSGDEEAVVDQLDRVMEVMMSNPAMQEMMLSRMPPHMRRPEVLKAMMANPEVRQRIATLAQQSGLGQMLSQLDPGRLQSQLSDANQAGLDPTRLFERFQQSPTLGPRMSDPRVLAALMDMASNGPEALKQYEGDRHVIEAAMEAGDIIQQMQQEQAGSSISISSSSSGASPIPTRLSGLEAQLGVKPQELMQKLMAKPELLAKVQDPKVQQALQEIAQSPWKIAKYMFNKDVMGAIKDLKEVLQPQAGKH